MTQYLLLLYAADGDDAEAARRWAEMPRWQAVTEELQASGVLVANHALHPVDTATTVRVRGGERSWSTGRSRSRRRFSPGTTCWTARISTWRWMRRPGCRWPPTVRWRYAR